MNNFNDDEQAVIDHQGWNSDSLVTLLSAYDSTSGMTRVVYLRRKAAEENGVHVPDLVPLITHNQLNMLSRFECRASDDSAKTDLELICTDCGEHVCDVEHADGLGVLASVAQEHTRECVPNDDEDEDDDMTDAFNH